MSQTINILATLLSRGDKVSIVNGRLAIEPKSGNAVPSDWLANHNQVIIIDCLRSVGVSAFRYTGYSTGQYNGGKFAGITLQFEDVLTGGSAFACFNAIVKRQRNGKHGRMGEPLPVGEFRVKPKAFFNQFWSSTGLAKPPRYYDRMGNLSALLFTAEFREKEKLINATIKPLNIPVDQISLTTKPRLSHNQATTKERLSPTTKEINTAVTAQAIQPDFSKGENQYGKKVIREDGYKGNDNTPLPALINQSNDEWLSDYNSAH
jgi:hypothetical protein